MRPWNKNTGLWWKKGFRLPPGAGGSRGRRVWRGWAPRGSEFISKVFSLAIPIHILPQGVLRVHWKASGESRKNNCGEKVRDRFLSMALVSDQRDCLLILILDIESFFLNLEQLFSRGRPAHEGLSKPLQSEALSYPTGPYSPPPENLHVMIEIPDRSVLFMWTGSEAEQKAKTSYSVWSRHQNYGVIFFFFFLIKSKLQTSPSSWS